MREVKNKRVLRTLLLLGVCIACATAMFWSTASANGVIQYVRTDAAAQQQGSCDSQDTCLEWTTFAPDGTPSNLGIFCCGNESQCSLIPGGPF